MSDRWYLGKVFVEYIRALKPQPLLLGLVGINVLVLVLVYFATLDMRNKYNEIIMRLIDACRRVVGMMDTL